jgi:hypothetical protein
MIGGFPLVKHVTSQGETWDIIAHKKLGSEKLMNRLISVNPEHRNTVVFSAGTVLQIPEIQAPVANDPVPPWQR